MSWAEDEEDGDTMPCPYCRRDIHADSVRCPHCEQYLSEEDQPDGRGRLFWTCALVCLVLAVGWALLMW
jgi:hypothetical protein